MNYRFGRARRLLSNAAFGTLLGAPKAERKNIARPGFRLSVGTRSDRAPARLGLRIAKKHLRRAVDRSLLRRIVREAFRHRCNSLLNCDLIFHSGNGIRPNTLPKLRQDLNMALDSLAPPAANGASSRRATDGSSGRRAAGG